MKKILAAFLTILALPLAWSYQLDSIAISDYEFRRFVRPQLRSISNEYQTLLFALNPELKDFKKTYSEFRDLTQISFKLKDACSKGGAACLRLLTDASQVLKEISKDFSQSSKPQFAPFSKRGAIYYDAKEKAHEEVIGVLLSVDNHLFLNSLTGKLPVRPKHSLRSSMPLLMNLPDLYSRPAMSAFKMSSILSG